MVRDEAQRPPRASAWEIVGAWLHLWTPPRDVEVPRIPRRGAAIVAAVLAAVAAVVVLVLVPAIDSGKRAGAERRARAEAAHAARLRADAERDQQPHTGSAPRPAPGLDAAGQVRARRALVARVE
jgi:hypothetical protein